jgi:hypothetical protein
MNNQIRLPFLILIMTGCAFGPAFSNDGLRSQRYLVGATREDPEFTTCAEEKRPSRCTKLALAVLQSIPMLSYKCDDDNLAKFIDSARRRAAIRAYSRKLELAAGENWWTASVDDLNGCTIIHKARALTHNDQRDLSDSAPAGRGLLDSHIRIVGDASTRLVLIPDRCMSEFNDNVFLLQRADGRTYATEVVDVLGMRDCAGFQLARQNDESLVIIETSNYVESGTWEGIDTVFSIDPASHHAVPRKLFLIKGKLTNEFRFDRGLFEDEELEKQWRAPELVHNGMLSPSFHVYFRIDNEDRTAETRRRFFVRTYVWNGRYYALQRKRPGPAARRRPTANHQLN